MVDSNIDNGQHTCECGHIQSVHFPQCTVTTCGCGCQKFKEVFTIKDSGERQKYSTGAVRQPSKGKGRFDLIPAYALKRLAIHYENGAAKYSDDNWRKGMHTKRFMESALRHLNDYLDGNREEDHLSAAVFNIFGIIETQEMIRRNLVPKEFDNIPDWCAKK